MASKIFSGDLPELLNEIIQYFQTDFSTLHSCILVNRLWCRFAIPLLWENPFSIPTENCDFIKIYLYNLNDDDKTKLIDNGIDSNLFPTNVLFNYHSFIKYLNMYKVCCSVEDWILNSFNHIDRFSSNFTNSVRLIFAFLSKTFIESKAVIHTLEVCYDRAFIAQWSAQIINSQQNLKKVSFNTVDNLPFYHPLLSSLINSNCSNTLKIIIFYKVNFTNVVILNDVFENLTVLESIHILYCSSLNYKFIQQIINLTKPFKLKSLFIDEKFQIESSFQLLLQKSGDYLENIGFESSIGNGLKQQLLDLIKRYCNKIEFFGLLGFNNRNIYSALDLIEIIKPNLNYLSINFSKFNIYNNQLSEDNELSSIVLRNLGQILPSKLEYLSLCLKININDFEVFLKNSQNTFIKKLLIRNKMHEGSEDILPYIKKYIMKKKRVRYLAFKEVFVQRFNNLSSLKDEVLEFELHNIEVQTDDNLDLYDLMRKNYIIDV